MPRIVPVFFNGINAGQIMTVLAICGTLFGAAAWFGHGLYAVGSQMQGIQDQLAANAATEAAFVVQEHADVRAMSRRIDGLTEAVLNAKRNGGG